MESSTQWTMDRAHPMAGKKWVKEEEIRRVVTRITRFLPTKKEGK